MIFTMKKTSVSFIYNFLVYLFKEITAAGFIGFLVAYKFLDVFLRKVNFVYAGDTSDITYAGYLFIARTLKQGIFPLWDPHIFGGIPLTAYAQVGLYYPFNIIFWLLPYGGGPFPYSAYQYLVTFHIFLAGWFMYLLGRTLGFRRIISVIMGMTYMFSPNILIYLGWGNQIVAFPWFPLVLACIFKALIQKKPLYSIYGGLLLGILILASPAQPAIQGLMLVVFSMISQILFTFFVNDKKNIKTIIFSLQIHLTILAIGVLIGSIELLPILEFLPRSIRFLGIDGNVIGKEKIPFHAFTTYKSSIEQLKGFLFISFANTPMAYNFYGYIPFVFSVVSVFIFFRKNFVVFFLSLLGLFSFLYSIGFIFPNIFCSIF